LPALRLVLRQLARRSWVQDMDDEDFQSRLDKIHEDHARFMALVESMPPLTKQQKEENRARLFAEEEPLRIAKREELSRQALQGDPHAKLYPPPDEIFPPLPWKPRVFLNLSRFHWKANIELCAVALAHETGHHLGGEPRDPDMTWMTGTAG
jgi:hypothetical protein